MITIQPCILQIVGQSIRFDTRQIDLNTIRSRPDVIALFPGAMAQVGDLGLLDIAALPSTGNIVDVVDANGDSLKEIVKLCLLTIPNTINKTKHLYVCKVPDGRELHFTDATSSIQMSDRLRKKMAKEAAKK